MKSCKGHLSNLRDKTEQRSSCFCWHSLINCDKAAAHTHTSQCSFAHVDVGHTSAVFLCHSVPHCDPDWNISHYATQNASLSFKITKSCKLLSDGGLTHPFLSTLTLSFCLPASLKNFVCSLEFAFVHFCISSPCITNKTNRSHSLFWNSLQLPSCLRPPQQEFLTSHEHFSRQTLVIISWKRKLGCLLFRHHLYLWIVINPWIYRTKDGYMPEALAVVRL